jgi:hypothetical protein
LTYSDNNLPEFGSLCKSDYQLFLKRLRFHFAGTRVKYFLCGEYGDKYERPHYHLILFGIGVDSLDCYKHGKHYVSRLLNDLWSYGYNTVGSVTPKSVNYVASYCQKKKFTVNRYNYYDSTNRIPPFTACSNGIGLSWCMAHADKLRALLYVPYQGFKLSIPRYYRKKLGITAKDYLPYIHGAQQKEYDTYIASSFAQSVGETSVYVTGNGDDYPHLKDPYRDYRAYCRDGPYFDGFGFLSRNFLKWRKMRNFNWNSEIRFKVYKKLSNF